jgi:hypothetical protein
MKFENKSLNLGENVMLNLFQHLNKSRIYETLKYLDLILKSIDPDPETSSG